jgi:hypothetical protein
VECGVPVFKFYFAVKKYDEKCDQNKLWNKSKLSFEKFFKLGPGQIQERTILGPGEILTF